MEIIRQYIEYWFSVGCDFQDKINFKEKLGVALSVVKQIIMNTFTGWLAVGIRGALALVIVPFLLTQLGKEGFGLIGLLGVIVSMAAVADLGLRSALGRELAEQLVCNDRQAFSELASTALALYLCIACVLGLIGWMLAPWVVEVLRVSESLQEDAVMMIRVYGTLSILFSFITPVFSAALSSHHRFDVVNSVQIIGGILSSIVLLVGIPIVENPLYGWVGIMLISEAAILLLTLVFFRKFCKEAEIRIHFINRKRLVPLFHLGGYLYVIQIANMFSSTANPLFLSTFMGPVSVALYQPASKLSAMFSPIVMTLTEQLYPLTTRFHTTDNKERLQQIFCLGAKYTLLLGCLVSACIFIFAEPLARLWLFDSLGTDYLIVVQVMQAFAIVDLLAYASGTQWPILLGMRKLEFLSILLVLTAILSIAVSIYFVGFTSVGVVGVLYGTIIGRLIKVVLITTYVVKLVGFRMIEYIQQSIVGPMFCLFFSGMAGWVLVRNFLCDSWIELLLMVGGTALVWFVSCWFLGLNLTERYLILTTIKKIYQKVFS